MLSAERIWDDLEKIRRVAPLVHNITNYVVMNTTANGLLALGASPVMAHAEEEVAEMAALARALVINIGTLSPSWILSMEKAMIEARRRKIPIVFDPVGAGATSYRTRTAMSLMAKISPDVIRGNASEIMALAEQEARTKGVDSLASSEAALEAGRLLSRRYGCVVCVSGKVDLVTDGSALIRVQNGHAMMSKVTGLGCTATALIGAFCAVNSSCLEATAGAMAVMGIAGEIAAARASGPGTLQLSFYDVLFNLSLSDIKTNLRAD